MEAVAETETSTTLAKTSSLMNPKGKGKGRRHQIGVKNAAIRLMAECECSTSNAVRGISIVLEEMCGEKVDEKDFANPITVGRWHGALSYIVDVLNAMIYVQMEESTLCRDGSDKSGTTLNVASMRGTNASFTTRPWVQATKSAEEIHQCTINILDAYETLYAELYRNAVKNCSDTTVNALPQPRDRGEGVTNIRATMTDHAANKRAANRLMELELRKRAPLLITNWDSFSADGQNHLVTLVPAGLLDHKRNLFCDECIREETKLLHISLGIDRCTWELNNSGNLVNAVLRQCHKEFGQHEKDAYEFGHGTVAFPVWFEKSDYTEYQRQKRYVGNRHDINFENAMINYPMIEAYTEWLRLYVMTADDNKLQHRLLLKLQSNEVVGALQARAIFHIILMQPLQVLVESTPHGSTYIDMIPVVKILHSVCTDMLE
jgi:hypothetical protein